MSHRLTVVATGAAGALLQAAIDALEAMEQSPTTGYARTGGGVTVEATIEAADALAPPPCEPTGVTEVVGAGGARLYLEPSTGRAFYALFPPPDAVPLLVPTGTPHPPLAGEEGPDAR